MTTNPPENDAKIENQTGSTKDDHTTKEIILKEVKEDLEKYFGGEGQVDTKKDCEHGDVQMKFKHDLKYWMLRFPETFPNEPAQIFRSFVLDCVSRESSIPSDSTLEKPLTNRVNIFLSIKNNCSGACKICKDITRVNLSKLAATAEATAKTAGNTKLQDVVKALTNELKMTDMATPSTLADEPQNDGSYKITFEHNMAKWFVTFPPDFPAKQAEVLKKHSYGGGSRKVKYISHAKHEEESLVTPDVITLAIFNNCDCLKCRNKRK
jgi:hypothetical protein